jgi:hypothetical protein
MDTNPKPQKTALTGWIRRAQGSRLGGGVGCWVTSRGSHSLGAILLGVHGLDDHGQEVRVLEA